MTSLTPFNRGVLVARQDGFECCERIYLSNADPTGRNTLLYHYEMGGHSGYLPAVAPFVAGKTAYFTTGDSFGLACALLRTDGSAIDLIDSGDTSCELAALATFGGDLLLIRYSSVGLLFLRATPTDPGLAPVTNLGDGSFAYPSVTTPTGVYFLVDRVDATELWRADSAIDPPSRLRRFERDVANPRYARYLMPARDGVLFWTGDSLGRDDTPWNGGADDRTVPIGVLPSEVSGARAVESDSLVFVVAYDAEHGGELWAIDRAPVCTGDCDVNGAVDVALGLDGLGLCPAADENADLRVSVDELVASVRGVLDGCPAAERRS